MRLALEGARGLECSAKTEFMINTDYNSSIMDHNYGCECSNRRHNVCLASSETFQPFHHFADMLAAKRQFRKSSWSSGISHTN